MSTTIHIAKRFCGPPASGNGGYSCGLIAQQCEGVVDVRLVVPPPLDVDMQFFTAASGGGELKLGNQTIAHATPSQWQLELPPAPDFSEAKKAEALYAGFHDHALPGCFVCGPDRAQGDGLQIFVGEVEDHVSKTNKKLFAATWQVDKNLPNTDGKLSEEFIWAALDCPGYFAVKENAGFALLGAFSVKIQAPVLVGDSHVVAAWPIESEGRKHRAGSAIYSQSGECLAYGLATWITVPKDAYVAATA